MRSATSAARSGPYALMCSGCGRARFVEIGLHDVVPEILCAKNQLDQLTRGPGAGLSLAHPIHPRSNLVNGIARRGREADTLEHRQIDDVVAHVGDISILQAAIVQDL